MRAVSLAYHTPIAPSKNNLYVVRISSICDAPLGWGWVLAGPDSRGRGPIFSFVQCRHPQKAVFFRVKGRLDYLTIQTGSCITQPFTTLVILASWLEVDSIFNTSCKGSHGADIAFWLCHVAR